MRQHWNIKSVFNFIVKLTTFHYHLRNGFMGLFPANDRTFAAKNHAMAAIFYLFGYQIDGLSGMLDCVLWRRGEGTIERKPTRNAPG